MDPSGVGLGHLTDDELSIQLWDVARAIEETADASPSDRAATATTVSEIEAGIRAQAAVTRL